MEENVRDQALFDALTETIDFELRAQLASPDHNVDADEIRAIAGMVADQVLTEFNIAPREPLRG
jgi:hypothetical protein